MIPTTYTAKQIEIAGDSLDCAVTRFNRAIGDIGRQADPAASIKAAIGYMHEAAEAMGMKLIEAPAAQANPAAPAIAKVCETCAHKDLHPVSATCQTCYPDGPRFNWEAGSNAPVEFNRIPSPVSFTGEPLRLERDPAPETHPDKWAVDVGPLITQEGRMEFHLSVLRAQRRQDEARIGRDLSFMSGKQWGEKVGTTPALTQPTKARRRAIAAEWSTYLGVKIRARHVKAMMRLADDVGDEE